MNTTKGTVRHEHDEVALPVLGDNRPDDVVDERDGAMLG